MNWLYKEEKLTPLGWIFVIVVGVGLLAMSAYLQKQKIRKEQKKAAPASAVQDTVPTNTNKQVKQVVSKTKTTTFDLPTQEKKQELPSPPQLTQPPTPQPVPQVQPTVVQAPPPSPPPAEKLRSYDESSFENVDKKSDKLLSDIFLPKGFYVYAVLTADIVSNNQKSPATATVITPAIFNHKVMIPVGTQITGKIDPGALRGRVFVNWDTLIFYDDGRQGAELPIKGIGMTYEQHQESGRWVINGAGLKGYLFDDSASIAFKLATLKATEDFMHTLQTYVTVQNSTVAGTSVITSTTTTPEASLKNAGLSGASGFIDVVAKRYETTLQQSTSFVVVPTSRLVAIFLDQAIDIGTATPGRSLQTN